MVWEEKLFESQGICQKYGNKSKSDGNVKQQGDKKPAAISDDFKIALAAMMSSQDYETLKSQFFSGN